MDFAEINYLLNLARIKISDNEKKEIAADLAKILDYVNQLQEVKTDDFNPPTGGPMAGGTFLDNIYRTDEIDAKHRNLKVDGYFKVPPIFE